MNAETFFKNWDEDLFDDDDIRRCTGLSVRSWRELLKQGAVQTHEPAGGRGKGRKVRQGTFMRAAIIAELNRAGYSLQMAGRLAYFIPSNDAILIGSSPDILRRNPEAGIQWMFPGLRLDRFFADHPVEIPESDSLLEIFEQRFLSLNLFGGAIQPRVEDGELAGYDTRQIIFGEIISNGTSVIYWHPFHQDSGDPQFFAPQIVDAFREFTSKDGAFPRQHSDHISDRLPESFLDYRFEDHKIYEGGDETYRAAKQIVTNASSRLTINLSLTVRKAIRIYLKMDPPWPGDGAK